MNREKTLPVVMGLLIPLCALIGCRGDLSSHDPDGADDTMRPPSMSAPDDGSVVGMADMAPGERDAGGDAGMPPEQDCSPMELGLQQQAGDFLQAQCVNAACHGPVGPRAPELAASSLAQLVSSGVVVPGDPDAGRLMARVDPDDPRLIMPPTRQSNAPEEIAMLRQWIEAGAPTHCDIVAEPVTPHANSLSSEALFVCMDAAAPRSSPSRLRLVESSEWIHGTGGVLSYTSFLTNPFVAPSDNYSTFAGSQMLTKNTLGLYLDVLERSLGKISPWYERPGIARPSCLLDVSASAPDDACLDGYVGGLLEHAVLFRAPTDQEHALVRKLLVAELGAEPASPDKARRAMTLQRVTTGAWLLPGALFRSDMGEQTEGERWRLDREEAGQALAGLLTSYPMTAVRAVSYAPRPELGWVEDFRARGELGAFEDVELLRDFIGEVLDPQRGYLGGVDDRSLREGRADLQYDYEDTHRRYMRGEYWLAPRISSFFREYFAYDGLPNKFKDDPIATTSWVNQPSRLQERVRYGYTMNLTGVQNGAEPLLAEQLDDAIARAVIESEQQGEDVFRALLLGRKWRVPGVGYGSFSLGKSCDVVTCNPNRPPAECCNNGWDCLATRVNADGSVVGYCGGGESGFHRDGDAVDNAALQRARVYNVMDPIPLWEQTSDFRNDPSLDARWMTMAESERAGVLTHPAWLSAHGSNFENEASAVLRGKWIREHLFCEEVGGLDIVQLEAKFPEGSEEMRARDRLHETFEGSGSDARCNNGACHAMMNSLGLPFEIYNHAGFLRADDHGFAPDGSSLITNWPGRGAVEVDDAMDLVALIADDPHARRCFIRHVFRYFMGRYEREADACTLAEMERAFEGGSFFAMLQALGTSDTFLYRHASGGAP